MDTIDVDGINVAFERSGNGPALVLLHGYVGDGRATWSRQIEGLSDAFTVVAWDAPGAGGSSDPPDGFGMAGYADCLARFIDEVGLSRPHVAGLSFGGALAIECQHRHPDIARTLTLVSAYAGWGGSLPADVAAQRLQQAYTLAAHPPDDFVGALLPSMFSSGTPQAVIDSFGENMRAFHPRGFVEMARACAENLRDALPGIKVPTLLLHGDRDVRSPFTVAEDLHAAIAGSELVVLPGAGHVCNLEAPGPFNRAVRRFLDGR
jgi:pimeloyl-ACP methyl ester carboxylesterase